MGKITLYVDDTTEKLLKKDRGDKSYSEIFKAGLKQHLIDAKELNETLNKLPSEDEINDTFRGLPTVTQIEALTEAFNEIPSEDNINDMFRGLPTVEGIEQLNNELDETIEKLERIKELK